MHAHRLVLYFRFAFMQLFNKLKIQSVLELMPPQFPLYYLTISDSGSKFAQDADGSSCMTMHELTSSEIVRALHGYRSCFAQVQLRLFITSCEWKASLKNRQLRAAHCNERVEVKNSLIACMAVWCLLKPLQRQSGLLLTDFAREVSSCIQ